MWAGGGENGAKAGAVRRIEGIHLVGDVGGREGDWPVPS